MQRTEPTPDIMTPDQAAEYLQVDRETIYRYIRSGKLDASKLGRSYRVPRRNLELLLLTTRTRPYIKLREYSIEQIAQFREDDTLEGESLRVARRFDQATGGTFFTEPQERNYRSNSMTLTPTTRPLLMPRACSSRLTHHRAVPPICLLPVRAAIFRLSSLMTC